MKTTATTSDDATVSPRTTLGNFRVEYIAPDFSRGHSFEPRCAILADDAQFDGATVRVLDVPDPDESQREVAEWACEAMNQYEELLMALRAVVTAYDSSKSAPSARSAMSEIRAAVEPLVRPLIERIG